MSTLETPTEPTKLDAVIDQVLQTLSTTPVGTEEYTVAANQLSTLYKVKEIDNNAKLKVIESKESQKESRANLELKYKEAELKRIESEANLQLRSIEIELKKKEAEARTAEVELKTRESEITLELRELEIQKNKRINDKYHGVSPDTLALVAANIIGIAMIIGYERASIITTKAIGFIQRLR